MKEEEGKGQGNGEVEEEEEEGNWGDAYGGDPVGLTKEVKLKRKKKLTCPVKILYRKRHARYETDYKNILIFDSTYTGETLLYFSYLRFLS